MAEQPASKVDRGVVVIMAGGTGGHIFPGLATAEGLIRQGYRVHWLGTPGSMEAQLVPARGIDISYIPVTGLRGKGLTFLLQAPWRLAVSLVRAIAVLRAQKPVCVVGMGGYVTGPGGVAAKLLGVPLVVHEQNAVAGLTNKLLARIATRVLEAFPGTFASVPGRAAVLTGNPVRADIAALLPSSTPHAPLRLLVLGGSRGALAINNVVPQLLQQCDGRIEVWHQTGQATYEQSMAGYQQCQQSPVVSQLWRAEPFIEDMAGAYQWADLVLCRSGALTVAELAAAGKPAILIPFPQAVDDHQSVNGRYLVDKGAALMIQQKDLDVSSLTAMIVQLADNPERLVAMARAAKTVSLPQATDDVVRHCLEAAGREASYA